MKTTKAQQQAKIAFANYCKKIDVAIGGAQKATPDGRQYIGNQFCVCRYYEATPAPTAQNDISTSYKKFFDDNQYKTNTQLFCTLDDIKNKIGDALFLKIGASYYSVEPLKKMMRTFDKNLVFYSQNDSNQSILYIIDINGDDGILLPVRENFINKDKAVIL